MITVTVRECQAYESFSTQHKSFFIHADIFRDGELLQNITVVVSPFCGEYEYDSELLIEDEEEEIIQIAIGQYFEDNNIDVGIVGR